MRSPQDLGRDISNGMKLKTPEEIEIMAEGGHILSDILDRLVVAAKPGTTTKELDDIARKLLKEAGAKSWFVDHEGFPASICTSINEEVVHGVPSDRILRSGDVLKIDFGVRYKGFNTDSARTVLVGEAKDAKKLKLISVTKRALDIGIEQAQVGNALKDIGREIQKYVESQDFNVVRELVGHGIGKDVHEPPQVLNYVSPGEGKEKLEPGLVIAIEPMVVAGHWKIEDGKDGFSFVTKDGGLAAQFEHTVAITKDGPLILTK